MSHRKLLPIWKKHNCENTTNINNDKQNRISDINTTKRENDNGSYSQNYGFKGYRI